MGFEGAGTCVASSDLMLAVNARDELLLAPTPMNRANVRTLRVGIPPCRGEFAFPWPPTSVARIIAIVPICILIAVFQGGAVGGLTGGGVKR